MTSYLHKYAYYLVIFLFYLSIHNVFAGVPELLTKLEKTAFETSNEYQSRVKPLIETFNKAVEERQPEYVAGHVTLDAQQYDIKTSVFLLKIQWTDWALPIAVLEDGMIKLQRDEAKSLFESSIKQALPVFINLAIIKSEIVFEKVILFGNGESREILIGGGLGAPEDLLTPKQDAFETDTQYQARRQHLLDYYNVEVERNKSLFQAGIVKLKKDSYFNQRWYLEIDWTHWVSKIFELPSVGYFISLDRVQAIRLLRSGKRYNVMIKVNIANGKLKPNLLMSSKKNSLPIVKQLVKILKRPKHIRYAGFSDALAFSPDGKIIVTGLGNILYLWDVSSKQIQQKIDIPDSSLIVKNVPPIVTFSQDSKRILIVPNNDKRAYLFDITGKNIASLIHQDRVNAAVFSSDGSVIVTGSSDQTARIWDGYTGEYIKILRGHSKSILCANFDPNGKKVITGSPEDASIRVWDISSGQTIFTFNSGVNNCEFSPDGKRIVASSYNLVELWSSKGNFIAWMTGKKGSLSSNMASFSKDGAYIFGILNDTAYLWDGYTGKQLYTFEDSRFVLAAALSHDNNFVVTTGNEVRLWNAKTGKLLATLQQATPNTQIRSVAFSPDDQFLVTGSGDQITRLWRMK